MIKDSQNQIFYLLAQVKFLNPFHCKDFWWFENSTLIKKEAEMPSIT